METFLSLSLRKRKDVEKTKITRFAKAVERSLNKLISDLEEEKEILEAALEDHNDVVTSNGHGTQVVRDVTSAEGFISTVIEKKLKLRNIDIKLEIMKAEVEYYKTSTK